MLVIEPRSVIVQRQCLRGGQNLPFSTALIFYLRISLFMDYFFFPRVVMLLSFSWM